MEAATKKKFCTHVPTATALGEVNMDLLKEVWDKSSRINVRAFALTWARNIAANWPNIKNLPGIRAFNARFYNTPALICAAGPSLESNLDDICQAQGKMLIIAVDTAADRMRKVGLEPDLIITGDCQQVVASFFDNHCAGTPVAACAWQDPDVFKALGADAVPFTEYGYPGVPAYDVLWSKVTDHFMGGDGEYFGTVAPGGGVGSMAACLALYMGCNPIVFAGLDLSFPDQYRVGLNAGKTLRRVFDMRMQMAYTIDDFISQKLWLENELFKAAGKFVQFINASGAGILTENCTHALMSDVLRNLNSRGTGTVNFRSQLQQLLELHNKNMEAST